MPVLFDGINMQIVNIRIKISLLRIFIFNVFIKYLIGNLYTGKRAIYLGVRPGVV